MINPAVELGKSWEEIQNILDGSREALKACGNVFPTAWIKKPGQQVEMHVTPFFADNAHKENFARYVRDTAAGAEWVIFLSESWAITRQTPDGTEVPSEAADRREIIACVINTEAVSLMGECSITRDADDKPVPGEWEWMGKGPDEGRFKNLISKRVN